MPHRSERRHLRAGAELTLLGLGTARRATKTSMRRGQLLGWVAVLVSGVVTLAMSGCSGRKQVPFGLEDTSAEETETELEVAPAAELPSGEVFEPGQVEVPMGASALVVQEGYALGALRVELDGGDPIDAIAVSADTRKVTVQAAFERGLGVASQPIDSFLVPEDCKEPTAALQQISSSLVSVRVDHACEGGTRTNVWILTIETQPRVRERITVLPPNEVSQAPIELSLSTEDRDGDGYEDVTANTKIGSTEVALAWLNRPGGFARDTSQPEAALRLLADDSWAFLESDRTSSEARANGIVEAFIALCRESGYSRIGLAGTQGIQCQRSEATARALSVAIAAAIGRGAFVRALELQRWWSNVALQPTPEEQALVQNAWQRAKASGKATWRVLTSQSAKAALHFRDENTLVVAGGFTPKAIALDTGTETALSPADAMSPARSPNGRFVVRDVRVTCVGFEAEIGPVLGKRTQRIAIERRSRTVPCRTPIDRPATAFEWAVLGWAPQGLVVASGDQLRVVPVDEVGKPAGTPTKLRTGSPLPAPVRGSRITPDGTRYVIPHPEGVVVRDWQRGGSGLWLRPSDWGQVPGALRALAISPSGKRIAVQKGNEIRLLTW